jgi:hypothetical protein
MKEAEELGCEVFERWVWEKKRLKPEKCQRKGVGYDYKIVYKDGRVETYEVKGSGKEKHAIPDMYYSEVDARTRKLKADYLFIVNNVFKPGNEVVYKIAREEFKRKNFKLKKVWRVAKFENKRMDNPEYKVNL